MGSCAGVLHDNACILAWEAACQAPTGTLQTGILQTAHLIAGSSEPCQTLNRVYPSTQALEHGTSERGHQHLRGCCSPCCFQFPTPFKRECPKPHKPHEIKAALVCLLTLHGPHAQKSLTACRLEPARGPRICSVA